MNKEVSQRDIEEKVVDYITVTGRHPKYVLLDSASYKKLCKAARPIERITMDLADETHQFDEYPKLTSMHVVQDCWVGILSVDSTEELFEVVG